MCLVGCILVLWLICLVIGRIFYFCCFLVCEGDFIVNVGIGFIDVELLGLKGFRSFFV